MNKMNSKTNVFTVSRNPDIGKPIVFAELVNDTAVNSKDKLKSLINDFIVITMRQNEFENMTDKMLDELVHKLHYDRYAWYKNDYCFEISEVYG